MGNSCCLHSRISIEDSEEELSEMLKVETILVKPSNATLTTGYAFNGVSHLPKISSDSSF